MNIGFDAKRAYHNGTGLGHYSLTLINSLAEFFPGHQYYLFNPKASSKFHPVAQNNVHEILPEFPSSLFPSAWRSSWVKKDLEKFKIDLYHGLSHEIPLGIQKTNTRSVVTIHDLIHERYPEQYNAIDVKIYHKKFRYACAYADKIIAISNQTKQDIIEFYKTPAEKITVCYQSCNPAFSGVILEEEKQRIKKLYDLPEKYFLYVGSIIERKNLLSICKALTLLKNDPDSSQEDIPLIVIGNGGKYKQQVKEYILQNELQTQVIFLSEHKSAGFEEFRTARDFPAIYQGAIAMIYPSTFEGFGIPVLEALFSKLPLITSNKSSLPEAGGDAAYYIDPYSPEEIALAMKKIFYDEHLRTVMIQKGLVHAQNFTQEKCAEAVMNVYKYLT
ncbi:MAG TPA: glycosyltransferase family 1 protein [Chitinophagaceae bacterium]|nr:glycosyltransferase family 1 protein [Chitinophagaceae bacterium]